MLKYLKNNDRVNKNPHKQGKTLQSNHGGWTGGRQEQPAIPDNRVQIRSQLHIDNRCRFQNCIRGSGAETSGTADLGYCGPGEI